MKSNEEFIAGIYEKAANYTEEKETNIIKVNWVAKTTRIVAMLAVCIGLAGVGSMVFGNEKTQNPTEIPTPGTDNYGIALTAELGEEAEAAEGSTAQLRMGPTAETVTFAGIVERIDEAENRIWVKLVFDEAAPMSVEDSVVCIRWDILEPISGSLVVGTELTATGALSIYENITSEHNGCAELVLTDIANLEIK